MHVVLQVVAYTMFLVVAQEALRRAGKWAAWAVFFLAPIALTPYWMAVNDFGPFLWFKTYTVFFCVCWGTAVCRTPLGERPWARAAIPLLLAANILEATALDALGRGPAHALNATAGLLLVVTMPYGPNATRVNTAGRHRDLHYATTRGWVVGYTLWNWTFVCLNYPALTGHHTAVLAAGLIAAGADPRRWTQARALTLGVNLLITAIFYDGMVSWMDTPDWSNGRLGLVAAGITLAFLAGSSVQNLRSRRRQIPAISARARGV